ncbi:MAG: hypothetical protein H9872_09870 [Candidatus Cellulosilyticum pullistercoris]|uniref:Uncharacterized protein n=1 Tax=Candidatus Cellulosilyticum pullistercoris TaxID=2838521 RepID=A0A9E2KEQ9_9FIRM|nr:hypothetical protein [Candidatus Cellulosilyticum pullistercoris]
MPNKPGSNNPMQKGERRQRLQETQNNHGEHQKKDSYRNYEVKSES